MNQILTIAMLIEGLLLLVVLTYIHDSIQYLAKVLMAFAEVLDGFDEISMGKDDTTSSEEK